jgi:hypothetical protein
MYFLTLVKWYSIYINDIVIVVSKNVDNVLLKMVDPTETYQGWIIKNLNFYQSHWTVLEIFYSSDESSGVEC